MNKATLFLALLFLFASCLFSQKLRTNSHMSIESGYLDVENGKLFYESAGEGDNIVLIHDGLIHREIWDEQFLVFADNFSVVRYDRRGYGKSPTPQTRYSQIEDLNQVFEKLDIDEAIVIGMSAGGGLAVDFTLKYPEKVSALILVGAAVGGYAYSNHLFTRGGRINLVEIKKDPKKLIQYFVWEDPYEIYHENVEAKKKCLKLLEENPVNVNFDWQNFIIPAERPTVNFLSEISAPTLILVGEYDIPDVHSIAGAIEISIPNSKREIIYKCGHLIPMEQPEVFNITVMKFLNESEL